MKDLADEQRSELCLYLLMTTKYRDGETETWECLLRPFSKGGRIP